MYGSKDPDPSQNVTDPQKSGNEIFSFQPPFRLNELVHFSAVNVTEVCFSCRTREGAGELLSWIQSTYTSRDTWIMSFIVLRVQGYLTVMVIVLQS